MLAGHGYHIRYHMDLQIPGVIMMLFELHRELVSVQVTRLCCWLKSNKNNVEALLLALYDPCVFMYV